ncbi:MAG: transporter substrate-binding domain-containing protein [Lachnospiraceae bacterium]|nr:transporter substrate-binding domain-containing protein [Lachnospiraceae bacterium]
MNKKLFIGCLCFMLLILSACGQRNGDTPETGTEETVEINENYVEEIKKKGHLTVGCKMDVPDLGFYDAAADTWSGLEVELAYQTAANLFEVSVKEAKEQGLVEFLGVTVADREEKLESGEVDCLFATYTITEERQKRFAFSDSYYTDYIGLLVNNSGEDSNSLGSSEIRSLADLDGKYIGVPRNATTRETFLKYIDTMNTWKVSPIFCEYESYEALFKALKDGNIDVMSVDVSILNGYVDNSTVILGDRFGGQHYGAAVKKENVRLLDAINEAVSKE